MIKILLILFLLENTLAKGFVPIIVNGPSHKSKMEKFIKNEWNCNPFICDQNDWNCKLSKCSKFTLSTNTECPNRIIGQNSTYCLAIGKNNLINNFFPGNKFNLILENDVVAECLKYSYYTWLLSSCNLYKIDIDVDNNNININNDKIKEENANDPKLSEYILYYYKITKIEFRKKKILYKMRKKQYEHYLKLTKTSSSLQFNDYDYDIRVKYFENELESLFLKNNYLFNDNNIKIYSNNGYSFTLPIGITYKYQIPYLFNFLLDIKSYDNCYIVNEYDEYIDIIKTWTCFFYFFY